jgi:tetratricopeptide (TPR) repeat protein
MDLATAREISTVCRSLAWLDYFVDEERMVLDGLIELYAGERSGDALARVRGLGGLTIALTHFGVFSMAHRYVEEETAIAQSGGDPAAIATAAFGRAWLQYHSGLLDECIQSFQQSAATYRSFGDIRGWGAPTGFLYWPFYWLADYASLAKAASELVDVGDRAADPHVLAWGLDGLGLLKLAVGPLDEASEHLLRARDLYIEITSYRLQAFGGGVLAKCRLRQGRLQEAASILQESLGLIAARNLRGFLSAVPLNAYAALCLINVERAPMGASRRQAMRVAKAACRRAWRYARDAKPLFIETQRLQGTLAWLGGKRTSALSHWKESIATAERVGSVVERARTLLEMGDRLEDPSRVDEATRLFETIGAKVDQAFGLNVRARLTAVSDTDINSALRHHDEAIAALQGVNAEYQLGLAYRRRAHLHERRGSLAAAHADLALAQRCFIAVGAATESPA